MRYEKYITRKMLRGNPNTLFVFGDNLARKGLGGQAREMRGEPNAVGIPTKNFPGMNPDDFFADHDFDKVSAVYGREFVVLINHILKGGEVVWPKDGIGTGLADLPNKAPRIWGLLEGYRRELDRLRPSKKKTSA